VTSPFAQFEKARSRIPPIILIVVAVIFAVVHTVTGWYWIPAFVNGTLFGWYWPLLFYTIAVEPVMGIVVLIGVILLVRVVRRRAHGRNAAGSRRWGIGLIIAAVVLGLTGLPAVFRPLIHDSTVIVNQNAYHLATYHDLGGNSVLLFECDFAGVGCQEVYRSPNYAANAIDSASLVADQPRGAILIKVCTRTTGSLAVTCDTITTFQQRLFK